MNKIFATVSLKSILVHIPCSSGIASFKTKFGHLDPDTPIPLLACLESNSVQDVIWALRAVHQDISAVIPLIAADFAESVLHLFEEKFPNDDRPRKAIEAARSGERKKARAASYASYAAYTAARETMLKASHSRHAPWTLVDFNDQRRGRLKLIRHLLDQLPDTAVPDETIVFPPLPGEPLRETYRGKLRPIR